MKKTLLIFGLICLADSAVLSVLLLIANPSVSSARGRFGVFLFSGWISLWLNASFFILLYLCRRLFGKRLVGHFRYGWPGFITLGLIGFNVLWVLWNRLGMAHQWVSIRPFLTLSGLLQSLGLVLLLLAIFYSGWKFKRRPLLRGITSLGIAALIAFGLLQWNRGEERTQNRIDLDSIRAALPRTPRPAAKEAVDASPSDPLIVLGIDGLEWSVVLPLAKAGRLPSFCRLIQNGAIGYLDNGDSSLSAVIWPTIFSGHAAAEHGVHNFQKIFLYGGAATLFDLLTMEPGPDTFFGLGFFTARLFNPGLWKAKNIDSSDIRVPMVWDVASRYGKKVVVSDVLFGYPTRPVDGAMVDLETKSAAASMCFSPPDLAEGWQPRTLPYIGKILSDETFHRASDSMNDQVDFTIGLIRKIAPKLAVYYTHYLDTVQHFNWDFYARGKFFLWRLPRALNQNDWERMVLEYQNDRCFLSYVVVDQAIEKILQAFPRATIMIVSDHGWTYSGYEHFSSPEGVILLSGPQAKEGAVLKKASIMDVVPTLLSILRIPVSKELRGSVLSEALPPEQKTIYIDHYGPFPPNKSASPLGQEERQKRETDRLRSMGYIK
jgi:predicted AlkP superfamily phosphohydrolase/phosphomutase